MLRGRGDAFFAFSVLSLCTKVVRSDIDVAAMRKVFLEMWWRAKLYAKLLKKLFVAVARLAAMCKGFKEMCSSYHYLEGFMEM